MARYLIGGVIVFDDDLYEMSRIDAPEEVVQLGAASSRCLQVLLEAKGQIVTKNDLLYKGWEQYKSIVTGNSINQAIAQIRKGLALLRIDPLGIITVPRIGYKISDDLAVEKFDGRKLPVEIPLDAPAAPSSEEGRESEPQQAEAAATLLSDSTSKTSVKAWILPLLAAMNLAAAVGIWNFLNVDVLSEAPQIAYVPVKQAGEMSYFPAKDVEGGSAHVNSSIAMLQQRPPSSFSTAGNRFIYINGARRDNVHSYFLCQGNIDKPGSRCVS